MPATAAAKPRVGAGGFGLLDLMIALMILGIVAVAAVPAFHHMAAEARLNAGAGALTSALAYARNLVVRYQRAFGVRASSGGESFEIYDVRWANSPKDKLAEDPPVAKKGVVIHPVDRRWYAFSFRDPGPLSGVDITSCPTTLEFFPDGHSNVADSVYVMWFAGDQRTVTVSGVTGRITVN